MLSYRKVSLISLLQLLTLSGCTQLNVQRHVGGAMEGVPYTLPATTLVVTVDYEIVQCAVDENGSLLFDVAKKATVTAETTRGERFVVPYESLRNPFKDTEFSVEHHPGATLKSVSAIITDQTGSAVTAAVGTVLRIAALQRPTFVASRTIARREDACTTEIIEALDTLAAAKAAKAAKTAQATKKRATTNNNEGNLANSVRTLAAQPVAAKKSGVGTKAGASNSGDQETSGPVKPVPAQAESEKPISELAAEEAVLESARQKLRARVIRRWTPLKSEIVNSAFSISLYPREMASVKWLTPAGLAYLGLAEENGGQQNYRELARLRTTVEIRTEFPVKADPSDKGTFSGLVVRQPTYAVVRACESQCLASNEEDTALLTPVRVIVPQLGDYVILPLKNRIFAAQTLNIALGADGSLEKIGLKNNAVASKAIENLNTNLDAYKADRLERQKLIDGDVKEAAGRQLVQANAVGALNKAIQACLEAQKAVQDASGVVVGSCQ